MGENVVEKRPYIITIQREFGSLGRPIAQRMSEKLGIEYYDRDIVEMASKEMNMEKADICDYDEKSYKKMKYPLGIGNTKMQDYLFSVQQCIISKLATKNESCIIVGRCSDYILRHLDNTINIFIYAPYEARVKNCIEVLGINPSEVAELIDSVDKARNNYHKYYTSNPSDTIVGRDILIDSSLLGIEGTADILVDIVKRRQKLEDVQSGKASAGIQSSK